ncbi:MAG: phosphate propanoyltransferase [Candidatus Hodarchaeales archaeon]|jgi:citrate synthase
MIEEQRTKDIGLRGIEVADTNICLIEGEKGNLYYRGYSIQDLVNNSTYEEVIYLLFNGILPNKNQLDQISTILINNRTIPPDIIDHLRQSPKDSPIMNILQSSLSMLVNFDPELEGESKDTNQRIGLHIIAKLPTVVAAWERIRNNKDPIKPDSSLSHASNFLYMLNGTRPTNKIAQLLDKVLILHAEHSFNASTFTARVIASTGATIYAAITGAIGSLSGKFHGGANPLVMKNLQEIGNPSNVEKWVIQQFDSGKKIMGMGHAVYKTMDPRAKILKGMIKESIQETKDSAANFFNITNEMVRVTQEEFMKRKGRQIYPNIDVYGATMYSIIGIPSEIYIAIFTISRVAGWLAHVLEEKFPESPEIKPVIYRPSAEYIGKYCGPLGCDYTPIDERNQIDNKDKLTKQLINQEMQKTNTGLLVPVALSARHIHLSPRDFTRLFGSNQELHSKYTLAQPKQFACEETVDLIGTKRAIYGVRVLGPLRNETQVEISRSDGFVLGINPPVRHSRDLEGTPGIHIIGPKGAILLGKGVIHAARHIHANPDEAKQLGIADREIVAVSFPGKRAGVLDEVMVRIDPNFRLEFHIDIDEGNALSLERGTFGHLIKDFNQSAYSKYM